MFSAPQRYNLAHVLEELADDEGTRLELWNFLHDWVVRLATLVGIAKGLALQDNLDDSGRDLLAQLERDLTFLTNNLRDSLTSPKVSQTTSDVPTTEPLVEPFDESTKKNFREATTAQKLSILQHEMIVPLATIQGYVEILSKMNLKFTEESPEEPAFFLSRIAAAANYLKQVLDTLMGK